LNTARYFFRNELAKAHEYIQMYVAMVEEGGWIWVIPHGWIGYGLVLFYEGRREEAIAIIRKARDKNAALYLSPTHEWLSYLIEAEFALHEKDEAACLNLLRSALSIGRRHNFQYYPWWRSDVMASLCAKALEHNIESDYVMALIKKRGLLPPKGEAAPEAWPFSLRIYTLGRFNVLFDNKPLSFTGKVQKKPLELLKALLSLEGRNVSEGQITDALWPESEGDVSHISFKTTLHRLRQLLGSENALEYNEGRLNLVQRYCWVDVWAFERLLYDGESQWLKRNQEAAVRLTEKAVKMYRGHFLSTESEKAIAAPLKERLRDKFLKAVKTLGIYYENSGENKKAIELFQKGLGIDRLSEELYLHLIKCHLKLGQKADALMVYKRCEKTLFESFGLEPSAEAKALYQKILN
jgi:DNA-binding SARP family transcriptional activator